MYWKNGLRNSLVWRLQIAFAVATLLLVGAMAVALDMALRQAFDQEDSAVLVAQAQTLSQEFMAGRYPESDAWERPEKLEWRLAGPTGRPLAESAGFGRLHSIDWSQVGSVPQEIVDPRGRVYSAMMMRPDAGRVVLQPRGPQLGTLQLAIDRSHEAEILDHVRIFLWIAWVIAVAVALLLGRVVAVQGLRPLRQIAQETSTIAPHSLDKRLNPQQFPHELKELVDTLNAMASRLHGAFARLSELGSNIAHELRTPIQNLRAEVEALLLRPPPPDVTRETLGSMLEEFDRLAAMIEQLLFLAQADDPRKVVARSAVDARQVIAQTLDFFEATADDVGVALRADVQTATIDADPTLLRRVLHNLLANALRHSPRGEQVDILVQPLDDGVQLCVADRGPGMPPELQARVGERFLRLDPSRNRDTGGSGLGLAIVHSIATLHGGRLTAGDRPGGGTQISVWFPNVAHGVGAP